MSSSLIVQLESVAVLINSCLGTCVLLAGLLGNLFNLILFRSPRMLKQSVSLYFVVISSNNLLLFLIGLTSRVIIDGFQLKVLGDDSALFCKVRTFFVHSFFSISNWLLVFATIDRFYSTNPSALKRNYVCSNSLAKKFIVATVGLCFGTHAHILLFYKYFPSLNPFGNYELTCAVENIVYNIFFAFFILIFYSLLPPMLIGILGLLTLRNIRRSRRTVQPTSVHRDRNQLIKLLSIQIVMLIILTIPHSIYWICVGFNSPVPPERKSALQREYERFFLHVVRLLLYINNGSSFYIQMTFSRTFRRDFLLHCLQVKRNFARLFFCQ